MQKRSDRLAIVRALLLSQFAVCLALPVSVLVWTGLSGFWAESTLASGATDTRTGLTIQPEGVGGGGFVTAYSALLGGLICLVPNCYLAYRTFQHRGARAAKQIVRSFYAGEAGKLAMTAVMFGLTFILIRPLAPLAVFIGFFLTQLVGWIVPLVQARRANGNASQGSHDTDR